MSVAAQDSTLVQVRGAARSFGAVQALRGVDLELARGECTGLVGHNGAGKSTLVGLLCGALAAHGGTLHFAGRGPHAPAWSLGEARRWGLRCVFQELSLCPNLTLAENMRVAQPPATPWRAAPLAWRKRAGAQLMDTLDRIFAGHGLRPGDLVDALPIGKRQMVEVARAFTPGTQPLTLVILDEPTSSLDNQAAAQLLAYIRSFVAQGKSCLLITHKLREIFAVTDRLLVLRDGQLVQTTPTSATDHERLIAAMGQTAAREQAPRPGAAPAPRAGQDQSQEGEIVLRVPASAQGGNALHARRGEVIGLAGLAGHGQTALLLALRQAAQRSGPNRGALHVTGEAAFVAGDRQSDGVFPLWSIARNMTVGWPARGLLIDYRRERQSAQQWRQRLGLVTPGIDLPMLSLSGGNQQKVLFARALGSAAPLILMDDPMRGVDLGSRRDMYALIRAEAGNGRTFIWYTTSVDELQHCDRVYVFSNGRVAGEMAGDAISEERMLALSFDSSGAAQAA